MKFIKKFLSKLKISKGIDNDKLRVEYAPYYAPLKYKTPKHRCFGVVVRRKRDSNPRRCDPQQFSRLPHSTTLPFLQKCLIRYSLNASANIEPFFNSFK